MNQILYKPILAIMQERKDYIDNNKSAVEEHKKHAKELIDDKDKKITEANKKSRDIVAAKTEALKEEESRMLSNTRADMGLRKRRFRNPGWCILSGYPSGGDHPSVRINRICQACLFYFIT